MHSSSGEARLPVSLRPLRSATGEYLGAIEISLSAAGSPRAVIYTAHEPAAEGGRHRDFSTWENAASYLGLIASSM